ncbi:MAG: arginine--tRNA ligase [Cellvibrionaceae bacterium]
MNIREFLDTQFRQAMDKAGIPAECSPVIALSKKAGFGDYQANGAMGAAKKMGQKPRDIAQLILDNINLKDAAETLEIAGPGFINISLNPQWLGEQISSGLTNNTFGITKTNTPHTIIIDYSSPNLAKEMHVGHLRSTIIGDTLARLYEYLGHNVIRQNHVGDWGTQFGMLIAELEDHLQHGEQAELALKDLETFYQQAKVHFDKDEEFATKARNYVVALQGGDEKTLELWQRFRDVSLHHSQEVYEKLNVTLTEKDVRGESFYNNDLKLVIDDLKKLSLAKEDNGAQVVFLEELADKEGNPSPVIVQKQDGGYLYSTSDLAAIRFRANTLKADRIMVVVDFRQSLHLKQVFTIARKAKFLPESTTLEHHSFGTMLGKDGKPFKTRTGGTVKLADLLVEATERAEKLIAEKDPDLSEKERYEVAKKVGIGAVKYADLCKTRTNDYMFNWDSMLSFEGNTAPYLQYAYTRIQSIFRKADIDPSSLAHQLSINAPEEKNLAIKCLQCSEILEQISEDAFPHVLCNYLYELASLFMSFYEACPILKEGIEPATRESRLSLSYSTAETLRIGLDILGIETMKKM